MSVMGSILLLVGQFMLSLFLNDVARLLSEAKQSSETFLFVLKHCSNKHEDVIDHVYGWSSRGHLLSVPYL